MLHSKLSVSLALAKAVAQKAESEAAALGLSVSVAVVGESGALVYFLKMDESSNVSGHTAIAKAQHAANYRRDTVYHEEFLKQGQLRILALPDTLAIEGGVQLLHEGRTVGAVGVSGASAADDGRIARAAASQLGSLLENR